MSSQQKHIDEADYRRYLNDEMTGEERNAFEKLLQKHPFEADALEGLQEISADEFTRDMAELKQRLGEKTQKSNRMIWWAAAATIAILVTTGILWYNLDQGTTAPQVAEHTATEKSLEKPKSEKEKKEDVVSVAKMTEEETGNVKVDKKTSDVSESKSVSDAEVEAPLVITMVENDMEETEQVEAIESPVEISDAEISGTNPISTRESKQANEILIVEDATMQNEAFEDPADAENDFAEPAMSRQAEVITSAAVDSQNPEVFIKARPIMIQEEFEEWMQSQAVLEKGTSADSVIVVLILHIDETGKITQFENVNQADSKYFKEARKIIRNGPPWQPATMNGITIKSEIELQVTFRKQ